MKDQLYNSRLINTYIKFIKSRYSYVNINELLAYACMEPYQVEDEGHWFTQEQVDLFYDRLVKLTGNDHIAREAGRYAVSPDATGVLRHYVLSMASPGITYELMGKVATNVSRSSAYECKMIDSNKVEITSTPNEGVKERPYQCENRIGIFEAILLLFGQQLPHIDHPECIFKGDKLCRYVISWQKTASDFMKRAQKIAILVICAMTVLGLFVAPRFTESLFIPAAAFMILALSLVVKHFEKKELLAALGHVRGSTDQLMDQINTNYKNVLVVNDIGLALSKQMSTDDILESVVMVLQNRLDFGRGMIMLTDEERKVLYFRTGFGYAEHQYSLLKNSVFRLDNKASRGVFVRAFHEQKPFLINDVNSIADTLSNRSLQFVRAMGSKSFICCPIIYEGESVGVLAVDNLNVKRSLVQSDLNLLMGIAPEVGISIHNANLIMARKRQFDSILKTLAASIDARDFLTAGHSEKVTEYAVGICKEMGMSEQECEVVRVASLLHDYGKIGIKDSILKKKGSLTPAEYAEIQTHSEKTKVILMQIGFEGIYKDVPHIAGCHHEKVDGSGYPQGLKGDDIPIGSRIIAVADFFEAVTAKRHYREPLPVRIAIQMLNEERDVHYDGQVIDAFLRYYYKCPAVQSAVSAGQGAGLYKL